MQFKNTVLLFLLFLHFCVGDIGMLANEEYFYNNQKYTVFLISLAVLSL